MADNVSVQEEILNAFPFLGDDKRWSGAVEVVRREVTYPDGNVRTYTDLRLRIGPRWLTLPRRGTREIIQALEAGLDAADNHFEPTPVRPFRAGPPEAAPARDLPPPQRRRVFDADRRNGRRGGRHTEFDE